MKPIYTALMACLAFALTGLSCSKDEDAPPPTADFSFNALNLAVSFTNQSTNGRYFTWDFGDGSTPSTEYEPGHAYEEEGTYTVKLTVTGRDGSTQQASKQVTVTAPPNLVEGGRLNPGDETKWTVLNISPGVNVTFGNGAVKWAGGGWGHAGIYQAVEVEANKRYQINMSVSGSGATDTWFEVYVGHAVPEQGKDYSDGGKRMGLSTWDGCGNTAFNGLLATLSCTGTGGGVVEFPTSGTMYLVIRSGGADLGASGITVDNIEMRPLE